MSQERIPQILFLDDDRSFLEMLENVFTIWSEGRCGIHIAENAGKALGIIQRNEVDLVAVDLVMPILDGVQFIGLLNRKYPKLLKVALSGSPDSERREACIQAGAELFLEKPRDIESMRSIFSTLEGLALAHMASSQKSLQGDDDDVGSGSSNGSGFRGMMRVGLSDIVQMECLGRNSSILQVIAQGDKGQVYIEDGEIIHAATNDQEGVEAFNRIMALKGGEFKILPFQAPGSKSIEGSWEFLLMEAARLADEQGHEEAQAEENKPAMGDFNPAAAVAPPGKIPPPGAAGSNFGGGLPPPGGMEFDFSGVPDVLVGPGVGKVSQPAEVDIQESDSSLEDLTFLTDEEFVVFEPETEIVAESEPADPASVSELEPEVVESVSFQEVALAPDPTQNTLDPAGTSGDLKGEKGLEAHAFTSSVSRVQRNRVRPQKTSTPLPRNIKEILAPEVTEFLIVSDRGVALHEWQTRGIEKRSNFIELLQNKTRQIAVGLPVGQFERMVVEDGDDRFICKIESEWRVFLHTKKQGSTLHGGSWG